MPKFIPVSFPAEWQKEIDELDLTPEERRAVRRLAAVFHSTNVVGLRMNHGKNRTKKRSPVELISSYYLAHSLQLAEAVYKLVALGFGPSSLILVRALIEADIDFTYLWLCKEINGPDADDRQAWVEYWNVNLDRINRSWNDMLVRWEQLGITQKPPIFDESVGSNLLEAAQEFGKRYGRKEWARVPSLELRARSVDRVGHLRRALGSTLEDDYITSYRWTSTLVHGTIGATNVYVAESEHALVVSTHPREPYLSLAPQMAGRFLLDITYVAHHLMRIDLDLPAQLQASGLIGENGHIL